MISVKDGVENLHKLIANNEEVSLTGLVDSKRRDCVLADALTTMILSALIPMVRRNRVIFSVDDESQIRSALFSTLFTEVVLCPFSLHPLLYGPIRHAQLRSSGIWSHGALYAVANAQRFPANLDII